VYGGLEPTLAARAATPMGYTPQQQASINTAGQQSAGGSTAAAVGQGGLYAARTRNPGAAQTAIGSANRAAGANLSRSAVGTQVESANLGQQNQRAALGGLQGVYGTDVGGGIGALNSSNQALQGASQSNENEFWKQLLLQTEQSAAKVASAGLLQGNSQGQGGGG
jgi:hypothetical protein